MNKLHLAAWAVLLAAPLAISTGADATPFAKTLAAASAKSQYQLVQYGGGDDDDDRPRGGGGGYSQPQGGGGHRGGGNGGAIMMEILKGAGQLMQQENARR